MRRILDGGGGGGSSWLLALEWGGRSGGGIVGCSVIWIQFQGAFGQEIIQRAKWEGRKVTREKMQPLVALLWWTYFRYCSDALSYLAAQGIPNTWFAGQPPKKKFPYGLFQLQQPIFPLPFSLTILKHQTFKLHSFTLLPSEYHVVSLVSKWHKATTKLTIILPFFAIVSGTYMMTSCHWQALMPVQWPLAKPMTSPINNPTLHK